MAGVELEEAKNKVKISKMSKIYQKVRLGKRRKTELINSNENDKQTKKEKSKSQKKTKEMEEERIEHEQQAKQLEDGEIL